jgi:integrase
MAIYKKRGRYYYNFWWNGRHIQQSTKQGNPRIARQMEAAHRTALAKGESGFREHKAVTLANFLKYEFLPFVESKFKKAKPNTLRYYSYGSKTLQVSDFASLDLREITDQHAGQYAAKRASLSPSTVNCGLRTLRRALSLAVQWGKLDRTPKITLAKGERQRERVLTEKEVNSYLAACPQPWKDAAIIMLGTGMRPGEVFALRWEGILLSGSGGLLQITHGKSHAAKRMLPLVPVVFDALKTRLEEQGSLTEGWIFPAVTRSGHLESDGLAKDQHALALKHSEVKAFEPYCLRHTALTNLGEAGVDPFTLARIAGHSSITITQRYVHPQADAIERAFAKLTNGSGSETDAKPAAASKREQR